ncbi:MAG: carboxypeptidase regulatory-like domain-containing protein [Elusimicrobia bacterium]|nr:carboxypeptidase regulatory-like domain-containing protein [Candidatus Liberimonas magnetica]
MTIIKKIIFIGIILRTISASSVFGQDVITTFAGTGTYGYSGDGGLAASARLYNPKGVAVDNNSGVVYICDSNNHRIRKVNASGIISTFAGTGTAGFSGDGSLATSAELDTPYGVAVDTSGNVYISDQGNNRIRKVNTSSTIATFAGGGTGGLGDGGPATSAQLNSPYGVAVDSSGNVYISDQGNNRIRKVNTSGTIATFAGGGTGGLGDGGPAVLAQLNNPYGVTVDTQGSVYISDYTNNLIRKVNASGTIATFAGGGVGGLGDGGPATSARLTNPSGIAVDDLGNVYISSFIDFRIRKVDTSGIISTFAGTGIAGDSGDGGKATLAQISNSYGVAVDTSGHVYISDYNSHRIRKVILGRGAIAGQVLDSYGKTAVSGVLIEILQSGVLKSSTTSDTFGNYAVKVDTGVYNVRASLTGYQPQTKNGYNVKTSSTVTVNFSLARIIGVISGKVTKSDGTTAVSGALVEAMQSGVTKASINTNTSGNYSMKITPGTYDVRVSSTGYEPQLKTGYTVADGSTATVNFSLLQIPGVISGKVTKSDGTTPVPGALIEILQSGAVKASATSDISGNYSITTDVGTYNVKASKTGYLSQTKTGYDVTTGSTKTVDFLLVELSAAKTGVISGKVTRSNGTTPVSGAMVEALISGITKANATTDASGNYSIRAGTGTYNVKASKAGYMSQTKTGYYVADGSTKTVNFSLVELAAAKTGVISGNVTRSDGITPASGAVVEALISGITKANVTTDLYGNYSITVGTGAYDVKASKGGYLSQTKTGYDVTTGSTKTVNFSLVELSGGSYGEIAGRVTKSDGVTPVFGAVIEVFEAGVERSNAMTDIDGYYYLAVSTGIYDIKASITGFQSQTKTFYALDSASLVTVDFSLVEEIQEKQEIPHDDKVIALGDNLFNPRAGGTCKVWFNLSQPGDVTIKVYDFMGSQVRTGLDNANHASGISQWNWDGKDNDGKIVPPGIYILYFKYPGGIIKRKIGVK